MNTADQVPVFESNFDDFIDYLHDTVAGPAISPRRYGQVLRLDMQTLAAQARVLQNTINGVPGAEGVQRYLRDALRVMRVAVDIAGNVELAISWFKNNALPAFDYQTPQDLVSRGRADALITYINSLRAGFAG